MQWDIDTAHSSVEFAVKHMGISTVRGRFRTFAGAVELDRDGRPGGVQATIAAESIDTGVPQRDDHLRSADFLDVAAHPAITFRSSGVQSLGEARYRVTGALTMHGRTHPVTLDVESGAPVKDPWGHRRLAATVTGTLNRKEWGLTWNQVLEFGALMVSEEVKLTIEVEVVASQQAAAA